MSKIKEYYFQIQEFFDKDVWQDTPDAGRSRLFTLQFLRIILLTLGGFKNRLIFLRASALAYSTILAIVPLLALAMGPELILLDEPTAGMTTEETRDAVKLIERITVGKTLIIIEHDMDVVFSISDRVSVLYYGKILATGTAEEIKENLEVKKAYLGSKK